MTLPPPINTGRGRGPRFNTHWVRRNVLIKKINKLDVNINAFIYWALKSITTFAFCRRWHGVLLNVAFKFSGGWKIKRTIVPGMIFIILWSDYMLGIIGQIKRMVFFFFLRCKSGGMPYVFACGYSGSNDTSFSNKRGWSLEGYGCEFKTHWVHVKKKMSYCWDLHGLLLVCWCNFVAIQSIPVLLYQWKI